MSSYMLPVSAVPNSTDAMGLYAKLVGKKYDGLTALKLFADKQNIFNFKFRLRVILPSREIGSAPRNSISPVVYICSQIQMAWTKAARIVTMMQHVQRFWEFPRMKKNSDPVYFSTFPFMHQDSIPTAQFGPRPLQTRIIAWHGAFNHLFHKIKTGNLVFHGCALLRRIMQALATVARCRASSILPDMAAVCQ